MTNKIKLSVVEKLLIAAYEIESIKHGPFSAEDLVVRAWKSYPDTFGLSGYRGEGGSLQYPDSNRVFAEIMGSKPIRQRGYLRKVGKKMYQLTEAGIAEAKRISMGPTTSNTRKISLPREFETELQRLFNTKAAEKARNNNFYGITFFDACSFWKISPRSSAIEFDGKIANFENILNHSVEIIEDGKASFTHGGNTISNNDLMLLISVHEHLLSTFNNEISIIRLRTDERI